MRHLLLVSGMLVTSLLAGCSSNPTTAPSNGGGSSTPPTGMPPVGGGGTSQQPGSGSPAPATAAVAVGDIFFKSVLNGSSNPAVDTVGVNGTVTWTWASTETLPHSVQSVGSTSFNSSAIMTGGGSSHQFTFTTPGTYQYDCAVHGKMMTGTIVVMAAAAPQPMQPSPMPPPSVPPGY